MTGSVPVTGHRVEGTATGRRLHLGACSIPTMNPQTPMAPPRWAALSKELDAAASLLAHGIRILLVDNGYSVLDAPAVLACLATVRRSF
jgi:hypothetical protein